MPSLLSLLLLNPSCHGMRIFSRHSLPIPSRVPPASNRLMAASKDPLGSLNFQPRYLFTEDTHQILSSMVIQLASKFDGCFAVAAVCAIRLMPLVAEAMPLRMIMRVDWLSFLYEKRGIKLAEKCFDALAKSNDASSLDLVSVLVSHAALGRKLLNIAADLDPDISGDEMQDEVMGLDSSTNGFGYGLGFYIDSALKFSSF